MQHVLRSLQWEIRSHPAHRFAVMCPVSNVCGCVSEEKARSSVGKPDAIHSGSTLSRITLRVSRVPSSNCLQLREAPSNCLQLRRGHPLSRGLQGSRLKDPAPQSQSRAQNYLVRIRTKINNAKARKPAAANMATSGVCTIPLGCMNQANTCEKNSVPTNIDTAITEEMPPCNSP